MKGRNAVIFIIGFAVFVCLFCGVLFQIEWLVYAVLGTLAAVTLTASAVTIIIITVNSVKRHRAERNGEKIDEHAEYVDAVENKRGVDRKIGTGTFYGNQWLNSFRTQTIFSAVGGLIFIAALALVPLVVAYYFDLWWNKALLGFCVGGISFILLSIITATLYRKIVTSLAYRDKDATEVYGIVVASSFVGSGTVGSGSESYGSRKVVGAVYRVKIRVDGKTVIGYSRNKYYNYGQDIKIKFNPKRPWRCYIIG